MAQPEHTDEADRIESDRVRILHDGLSLNFYLLFEVVFRFTSLKSVAAFIARNICWCNINTKVF